MKETKKPRPPEELVDALQDRVYPTSGRLLAAKPIPTLQDEAYRKGRRDALLEAEEICRRRFLDDAADELEDLIHFGEGWLPCPKCKIAVPPAYPSAPFCGSCRAIEALAAETETKP